MHNTDSFVSCIDCYNKYQNSGGSTKKYKGGGGVAGLGWSQLAGVPMV